MTNPVYRVVIEGAVQAAVVSAPATLPLLAIGLVGAW